MKFEVYARWTSRRDGLEYELCGDREGTWFRSFDRRGTPHFTNVTMDVVLDCVAGLAARIDQLEGRFLHR